MPPTNLRERIAALEQRNATNGGGTSRPISPTPSGVSTVGTNAPPGAFRDKIAKFERKGGVPVPRGRFGLGAPPTSHAPSRQGELYGNRIPAPARSISNGVYPASRAASPTGDMSAGDRRSFSLSSVISDFDDSVDYTPVSSPTFAFPPDSPESSLSLTPETSPSVSTNGDAATFNRPIVRGTSFQKALEIARTAELAKQELAQDPVTPTPRQRSLDGDEEVEAPAMTPAIVVSSEDETPVVIHDSPTVESPTKTSTLNSELGPSSDTQPQISELVTKVEVQVEPPSDTQPSLSKDMEKVLIHEEPQRIVDPATEILPAVAVVPLSIRKRRPTLSRPDPPTVDIPILPEPPLPAAESTAEEKRPNIEVLSEETKKTFAPSTIVADTPASTQPIPTGNPKVHEQPTKIVPEVPKERDLSLPTLASPPKPELKSRLSYIPIKVKSRILPSVEISPPQIVIHDEQPSTEVPEAKKEDIPSLTSSNKHDEFNSRKAALTLDPELLQNDSLASPALATSMSAMSLTDVMSNYFTGPLPKGGVPPTRSPTPPMSPPAKLAYDNSPEPSPRPRVKAPNPQSFLSPPPSGFLSAAPSSGGSSMGSLSSLGSRPMSMIETSPSRVTRALRMTPATSRGVPMFLPPNSARPRKSDFVYFPPTPDAEDSEPQAAEFGSATQHKASQSLSDLTELSARPTTATSTTTTFTAVVHGKVRETPASATMPVNSKGARRNFVPETPQMKRIKRDTILEPPMSPGQGELDALLQEAVLLEDTLNQGTLPTELAIKMEAADRERARLETIAEAEAKVKEAQDKEEERQMIAVAAAQLKAKRDEPTSGRLKHTFLIPLSKARSAHHHRKEVSAPSQAAEHFPNRAQEDPAFPPKSAGVPDGKSATTGKSQQESQSHSQRPVTPDNPTTPRPPETPPAKSPKPSTSRFGSFRRLGSVTTRPTTIHGHSARHSNSTSSEISSVDSQPVATPPEGALEFGMKNPPVSEFGHMSNGSTTSFPSLSPKKSTNSLGRATSFAEKMWSRARTKSSGSNLSATSEITIEDPVPRLPAIGPPPALELTSFPSVPVIVHPMPEEEGSRVLHPPKRSASLKRSNNLPPIPTEPLPSLPIITSTIFHSQTPTQVSDMSNDSLLTPPGFADSKRPPSWTSVSSAGSLPSPLFDKELFDAFPSVPGTTPLPNTTMLYNFSHRKENSIPLAAAAAMSSNQPSFDSALLSSAIHLASRRSGESAR